MVGMETHRNSAVSYRHFKGHLFHYEGKRYNHLHEHDNTTLGQSYGFKMMLRHREVWHRRLSEL
eukprot:scaffold1235_cov300-Pavlova_lutheri.AAC.16